MIKPSFADVAAKEQDQRSFFLRMYIHLGLIDEYRLFLNPIV